MKIEVIGVGEAFSPELGTSSVLVWNEDETEAVLMDCGNSVLRDLRVTEINTGRDIISKIGTVFVSHMHGDHVGCIGTMLQYRFFVLKKKTKLAGVDVMSLLNLMAAGVVKDGGYAGVDERIICIPTVHSQEMPSCAGFFNGVLWTGDTMYSLLDTPEARAAKIIIHDTNLTGGAHTNVADFEKAAADVREKTWIIHYSRAMKPELERAAERLGLGGVLRQGQVVKVK